MDYGFWREVKVVVVLDYFKKGEWKFSIQKFDGFYKILQCTHLGADTFSKVKTTSGERPSGDVALPKRMTVSPLKILLTLGVYKIKESHR